MATDAYRPASRLDSVEISLIRRINALATPLSTNLGIGEPNVEPDLRLRAMAASAAAEGSWKYTANAGTMHLRQLIASAAGESVDPKTGVCITAGTEEGLYAIMQAWIDPGDEVLIPDPGFVSYSVVVRLAGGTAIPYPLDPEDWSIEFAALESLITPRTKMIVINSPSNPTGSVLDETALDRVVEIARKHGLLVVSDEVYRQLYFESEPPTMTGRFEGAIVVDGMSKSHSMTGLRIGWILADEKLLGPIVRAHQYIATCASSFSQSLAERVLEDRDWNAGWLASVRETLREQRDAALEAAERWLGIAVPGPRGAFYLFAPVPSCNTVDLATRLARDAAVLAIPGVAFGGRGEGFLRISYAASIAEIRKGIERIGRYLDAEAGVDLR